MTWLSSSSPSHSRHRAFNFRFVSHSCRPGCATQMPAPDPLQTVGVGESRHWPGCVMRCSSGETRCARPHSRPGRFAAMARKGANSGSLLALVVTDRINVFVIGLCRNAPPQTARNTRAIASSSTRRPGACRATVPRYPTFGAAPPIFCARASLARCVRPGAAHKVRAGRQPEGRQGTWAEDSADAAAARRRGDSMTRAGVL